MVKWKCLTSAVRSSARWAGKTLYVAGDSIAYGKSSAGGYGKCIADKYGMTLTNEAVDGATLTPDYYR